MFLFLFHSIPWMTQKEQSKKLCITLFLGIICYIVSWTLFFNKKDSHFLHGIIYYSLLLVLILDLALLIYSYKEMKNRDLKNPVKVEEAYEELMPPDDPPIQEEQTRDYLLKLVTERSEQNAANEIQNWWIRWRKCKNKRKIIDDDANDNTNNDNQFETVSA